MPAFVRRVSLASLLLLGISQSIAAQAPDLFSAMHWRGIGPPRAGRARALAGVPSQPNTFYIGFDNGGVWRTTDYGSNWVPLFDKESTGSIGAIGVSASDPNVIYVGTGAGIIRPDLSVGNGVYKSTDAGKTWTHLGLFDTQMIGMIDVDPKDPNRVFVAALGHPYGPNAERGVFRSTDGGKSFQKVLYVDEYTSANDVRIDPSNPNIVYAALWQQQQGFSENGAAFSGASGGLFKSTDGGTTWKKLTNGLPNVGQANLAIAPSNSKVVYAVLVAAAGGGGGGGRGGGGGGGGALLYKSRDGGENWFVAVNDPSAPAGTPARAADGRPMGRIGGGDLPTIAIDGKNENVIYSCSTVFWRSEDGGVTWSAVRGAPGGDDYQRSWNNPNNPDIIAVVADQGGVISANRGKSFSNWYTQPTAAMYHVTADNAFPYRLCGGQQDSGSACVDSRSSDGEITFHDWHPVNIQEYGVAAPDPRDPDMVFGSSRTGVSLYNRVTGQTTQVGPDASVKEAFTRNVRTQPIAWSPVNPGVLFYANNAVFKSVNKGHSWTRVSGDLTRQTWAVPTNAGKYAANVTASPSGTITALSPSPRNVSVIWAGTDDGNVQVTFNGGVKWNDVTPAAIKPWTRIFNLDAGHFDSLTAYVAANTLRLDDMNPHFWRTHDGGKTWTEINTGIAGGAVANSIREDPRKKGLLYAATDVQVWVSFDDGDHWQSLRLDMPAVSVRDIQVKDDSTCMCSDLVAGTHGRGFWILDNVTPLRQVVAAASAPGGNFLYKPTTAVRIRFASNDPTPWPPELPAGENPPAGAMIDYYLGGTASQVKLEILDLGGKVVRTYESGDTVRNPDPARDPEKYNEMCKATPGAADCSLPLYWPAPSVVFSGARGMHRFLWDMKLEPLGGGGGGGRGGGGGGGAVPHRTGGGMVGGGGPWAAPGNYAVRLTVDGKSQTQPITVRLDPRVKTPALQLAQLNTLTKELYASARSARESYTLARALVGELDKQKGTDIDAFKAQVEAVAPSGGAVGGGAVGGGRGAGGGRGGGGRGAAGGRGGRGAVPPVGTLDTIAGRGAAGAAGAGGLTPVVPGARGGAAGGGRGGRGGRGGGGAAAPAPTTLDGVSTALYAADMAMQGTEMAPNALQLDAATRARAAYTTIMMKWNGLKSTGLAALNLKRKAAGLGTVTLPK